MDIFTGKQNIFLTGQAGTGKTYALNEYIKTHPNTLIAASTGTAAVNLNAVTVHRLFSVPVPAYGGDPNKVTPSQLKIFAEVNTIIIDEVSMCRNDVFSFAMRILKRAEKLYGKKIRLIVSGDFYQLPPVVKKAELKYFTKYGFDKSGFAFTTKEWQECKFKTICLEDIKRQTNKDFIKELGYVRTGNKRCIPYFNKFVSEEIPEGAVYICGTNAETERVNTDYLNSIDSPAVAYKSVRTGITGKELPCDDILMLKTGLRVMFTANDTILDSEGNFNSDFGKSGAYQNGMFATVKEAKTDSVIVETEDGREIEVGRHKWSIYNYTVDRATAVLKKKEIGSILQIPLKIASAITIHKSQGKTFSNIVLSPQIFASGQLYVALSRVRGPEGLILTEPILPEYLQTDNEVKKFYKDFKWEVSAAQIKKQKEIEKKQTKGAHHAKRKRTTAKPRRRTSGIRRATAHTAKRTAQTRARKTSAKKKKAASKK